MSTNLNSGAVMVWGSSTGVAFRSATLTLKLNLHRVTGVGHGLREKYPIY